MLKQMLPVTDKNLELGTQIVIEKALSHPDLARRHFREHGVCWNAIQLLDGWR